MGPTRSTSTRPPTTSSADDGGVVLGGAEALWDLRTNKVMLVLVINPADRANPDVAAAPFN